MPVSGWALQRHNVAVPSQQSPWSCPAHASREEREPSLQSSPGHRADPSSLGNLNHLQRGAFNWLRLRAHCKTASKNRISAPPTLHSQPRPYIQGKWLDTGPLCRDFPEMRPCYGLVGLVVGLLGPVSSLSHEFKKWVLRRASGEERIDKGLASDSSR